MNNCSLLIEKLKKVSPGKVFLGFDGFVDEVVHVVKTRHASGEYDRMETLTEYGAYISACSGLSSGIEIATVNKKLGGNAPNMGIALKQVGFDLIIVAAIGEDAIDPVFHELIKDMTAIGIAEPGRTDAIEFLDGKHISTKTDSLNKVCWDDIMKRISADEMAKLFDECAILAFVDWSYLANMTGIYRGLLNEVLPRMKNRQGMKIFIEISDPEKRTVNELIEALETIGEFAHSGYDTVLGLNKKEACLVAQAYGMEIPDRKTQDLETLAAFIFDKLNVTTLVIHPVDRSCSVNENGYTEEPGPYCETPVLTTGAGDTFNAGFVLGYINGFSPEECLQMGNLFSGYYVRNARTANIDELIGFIEQLADN